MLLRFDGDAWLSHTTEHPWTTEGKTDGEVLHAYSTYQSQPVIAQAFFRMR